MHGLREELVTHLSNGMSKRAVYFGTHPRVKECAREVRSSLAKVLSETKEESFFLGVAEGRLMHGRDLLLGGTVIGQRVVALAGFLCCGGFLLCPGITEREAGELFALANELKEPLPSLQAARALLAERGVKSIQLSPLHDHPDWFGVREVEVTEESDRPSDEDLGLTFAMPLHQSLFGAVDTAHNAAAAGRKLDVDGVRAVSTELWSATSASLPDLMQLVRYADHESYTTGHSVRVAVLALTVARQLDPPDELAAEFGTAALLHDVGKATIPREVLHKPGALDEAERHLVEEHPVVGATLLAESAGASPLVIACAYGHHRRRDGGYPSGCRWPVRSRLITLLQACDVFEALTAIRPHKPAYTPRRAYEILLAEPEAVAPAALDALVRAVGFYPPGTAVELTSGERARVLAASHDPALPEVRLTHSPSGEDYRGAGRRRMVLGEDAGRGLAVRRSLSDERRGAAGASGAPEIADLRC